MNYKKTIALIVAALPMLSSAQTQVVEYNPAALAEGVTYSLPMTAVNVDVAAIKTMYVPGEFAKYAERYLHVQGVKREREEAWEIRNIKVGQEGVPDTLKSFVIKMKDKSSASNVQLTNRGIMLAINTAQQVSNNALPESTATKHALNAKQYLTSEILEASSTAKMAELVAQEIMDIRDSKNAIRRGQADSMPKDAGSLRIVLDDLNKQEEALTQLFVGYTDTTVVYQRYQFATKTDIDKKVAFRFSKKLGFVDNDDYAGEPYYISIKDKHSVPVPTEKEAAKRKIQGVVYNIPGSAAVTISTMTGVVYDAEMPMGQFGNIDMLNNALFNKGAAPKVTFNPATGALLRLE